MAGIGAPVAELPAAASLTAAQQTARVAAWQGLIRKQLYVPETLPALEARTWSTFSPTPGVLADWVTYAAVAGMIVPAIVYRPDPAVVHWSGKLPGIVIVNGHGGDKFSWYAFYSGVLFAKAGAMVVTYDPIGEGERDVNKASRTGAHDAWVSPPAGLPRTDWGQRLAGLMQVDLMQAVTYLGSRPEVDASRIGVAAYSMGAFVSGITGAIDPRIHAVLLSGGGVYDGPGGYFDSNRLPCQMPPYKSLMPLGDRGAVLFALNAVRGPMLLMNGEQDTLVRTALQLPCASWAGSNEPSSSSPGCRVSSCAAASTPASTKVRRATPSREPCSSAASEKSETGASSSNVTAPAASLLSPPPSRYGTPCTSRGQSKP